MAKLAAAGTIRVGTKFDQPLFGLKGLDGKPEGFDVEIAKIVSAKLGIPADKIVYTETPSKIREDVIANDQVDMVVATYTINDARKQKISFAGPYYIAGQDLMVKADNTTITGPETLQGRQRPGLLGERLDAGQDHRRSTSTRPTSCCSTSTPSAPTRCATARSRPSPPTTSSSPASSSTSQGAFKLVNKPFTKEPYGIGITKGDTAFCQFINDTLKASDADGSYSAAWKATVGTVQPEVPPLPAADACS